RVPEPTRTSLTSRAALGSKPDHSSWLGFTGVKDSDRDQEDSHVFNQARDPAVKDKRRSPPSARSPSAPPRNPHHSSSTDEQESPERVVQKEKLHAELKQVLSQKRSHLRESTCQLAQPEMDPDPEPAEEQRVEEEASKAVEIVVETEAEAGASGYSVTGGGERGIFVKDVLKDSPAAKHLSLQQGDQLLSAKVYFDNVKYEDALKILQCAEPYKVSFLLRRTIPGAEVSARPRVPSVEVKGPKAKIAKMSVKGTKPFKTKKKRGGRFGLKRLKEKRREELVVEGTPPRLETGDVDVEFSLPKLKQKKTGKVEVEGTGGASAMGKAKTKIRFPHMKTKGYAGAETEGKLETGQLGGQTEFLFPLDPSTHLLSIIFPPPPPAPPLPGFLQITPEGSPQAQRRGEVGGDADVSGSFCLHTSGLDFTAQQMSEDRRVSSSEEGTVTTVTRTTRVTRQLVTTETRTGETSTSTTKTTTTRQLTDF
ncbi:uncharacterized protein prx, partial [Salarias fasciatus]|uniref:uncharacterized protein prx n=1 Tax=Salarias fasciatus TaxID=181472 RepID=UPI0011767FF8